jgi:4-hydroxyphenylpyruvate dioxygenase
MLPHSDANVKESAHAVGRPRPELGRQSNPLKLKTLHHIEFWVGNARQAAYYYRHVLGFSQVAYSGLETGQRAQTSYVLSQGKARFVLTSPLSSSHPASEHIKKHGDGVRDIVFQAEDADWAFAEAVRRGAKPAVEPHTTRDEHGEVRRAAIHAYGDTLHSFISYANYQGPFLPGYQAKPVAGQGIGILLVDHIVANVELGKMEALADFYSNVFGFHRFITFDDKDISTEYSALMSVVMSDDAHIMKFPINEPAQGKRKSQIEEYLEYYESPGVQHIALLTKDVLHTVGELKQRELACLRVPDAYYDLLPSRVGKIDEELARVRELGILVDRDPEGYLLQIFTKPVEDRPTLFYEIIQRKGSRGFGIGNFKALFEAIELEQARRGNL